MGLSEVGIRPTQLSITICFLKAKKFPSPYMILRRCFKSVRIPVFKASEIVLTKHLFLIE